MFKYFLTALIFLLLFTFGLLYILFYLFDDDGDDDDNDNVCGQGIAKKRNLYFTTMTELEARMMDIEVLSYYFDGVTFNGYQVTEDAIINTYSFVEANDTTYRAFIENLRIERLQERIKSDLVHYLDRNYSLKIAPGFTFRDYIVIDAGVYRRVLIKRVTAL